MTKKETLGKIKEHVVSKLLENQEFESICFANENLLNGRITLPVEYRFKHTTKTGRVITKKKTIAFFPLYCPFTGEKL